MGLFSKLLNALGRPQTPASVPEVSAAPRTIRNVHLRKDWLTLSQPQFFGQAYRSPNQHWVVGCSDSDGNGTGGFRQSGNGRVVLVDPDADQVLHELTCFARPTKAAVADTGRYVIHDCGFGSALQGDVVAVDTDGRERYRRHYSANIFNIGLSRCGRFAAIQTANAPSDDGNVLEVLDLEHGRIVFSVAPESGWADQYSFEVDAAGNLKSIGVDHRGLGRFHYSATGEFQDAQALQAARLDKGDYSTKLMAARDLLRTDATADAARKALSTADAALAQGAQDRPDWTAVAHRVRGEAYDLLGQLPEALAAYELALSQNPKIGVQRRASALRKKLGGT
ncbi:MAG: hypothetical protein KGJ38_02660 [Burkholderiaceae bacterium]|nr:hypothetical protein [Burkholderiaceae bacterium]